MFVLNAERNLFINKFVLREDTVRGGYWAIFKKTICWVNKPVYDYPWVTVEDIEIQRDYPAHYRNYLYHKFLFNEGKQE
jgi:hypothetical protein